MSRFIGRGLYHYTTHTPVRELVLEALYKSVAHILHHIDHEIYTFFSRHFLSVPTIMHLLCDNAFNFRVQETFFATTCILLRAASNSATLRCACAVRHATLQHRPRAKIKATIVGSREKGRIRSDENYLSLIGIMTL